jgi:hypothetical protein
VAEWRPTDDVDLDKLAEDKTDFVKKLTGSQAFDLKQKSSFDGDLEDQLKQLKITVRNILV